MLTQKLDALRDAVRVKVDWNLSEFDHSENTVLLVTGIDQERNGDIIRNGQTRPDVE